MNKAFRMPNGDVEEASDMDKLHHNVRHPTKDMHIVPGIKWDSLLSIPKFTDANYVAIFDKDKVNIYNASKTTIIVSRGAILRGWRCKNTNGESPSSETSSMRTLTQSSAIGARRNFYPQTTARRSNPQLGGPQEKMSFFK